MHYRERKLLSGIDVSGKSGKVSKTTKRSGRPQTSCTAENISAVVRKNRFRTIAESVGAAMADIISSYNSGGPDSVSQDTVQHTLFRMGLRSWYTSGQKKHVFCINVNDEAQWPRGSVSRFHTTGPGFYLRAGQGRISLSLFHWINKWMNTWVSGLSLQTAYLIGTSAHVPQRPMVTYTEMETPEWALSRRRSTGGAPRLFGVTVFPLT
ncbi:hypothetical protein TNCV_2386101 [Trichonephila clavipes]|nr:hypothetical protein TNCV_2386101 [Trichonephila clavipes]